MSKIKVVILSPSRQAASGVTTHANMLFASALAGDFELLHFQVGSEGRRENGLQRLVRYVWSPIELALLIVRTRPDVVHLNTSINDKAYWRDFVFLVIAEMLGCKVVNQIHGGVLPSMFTHNSVIKRRLFRCFIACSDVIVLISKEAHQAYSKFTPETRLMYIPNAIEHVGLMGDIFPIDAQQPLRLIYIGRLTYEKGLFEALEAIAKLLAQARKLSFQIVGSGEAERDLRERVKRLGIEEHVQFLGPIFGEAKNLLWKQADVFVFPTYSEGLPYSMLEAMAAGTPPITCPVGAIPDVLEDGVNGLFVPPRDIDAIARAITQMDDHRNQLQSMAAAGRRCISAHYTTERLAQDFHYLYSSLASDGDGGATHAEYD